MSIHDQDQPDVFLGRVLDEKYQIERVLGRGGMGRVYLARHVGTGRPVAVKVILAGLQGPEAEARFRREAQAAGSIRHPNVVDVTDFGVTRDGATPRTAYLVMEYLEGRTLKQLLADEQRLPLAAAVDVVEQIALALEQAHRRSIVHRDLKPDNIWLVPDARGGFVVKVLDFGVAALLGSEIRLGDSAATPVSSAGRAPQAVDGGGTAVTIGASGDIAATAIDPGPGAPSWSASGGPTELDASAQKLTLMGSLIGTPAFMSPEQCRGERVDARSDLYSLGLVAFEMLTGRRAFAGASVAEVVRQHSSEVPPRADAVRPEIPAKVADVIARSLAKDPAARHPSASAFAGSLRVAAEGATVTLRRALSLYSDRLDQLLAILLRDCWPLVAPAFVLLVGALSMLAIPEHFMPRGTAVPVVWRIGVVFWSTIGLLLWMLITLRSHALFAFVVDELRLRPLGELRYDSVAERLARRTGSSASAGFWARAASLTSFYFRCEAHAPVGTGDLAFLVAALESGDPKDAGSRCRLLAPAVRKTYTWVRMSILLSMFLLPLLEVAFVDSLVRLLGLAAPRVLPLLLFTAVLPLNALWVTPIFSIALALVYFRSRQAIGEDVSLGAVVSTRL
jgi:eukaryotic-like serine/threonine-protein kinase